MADESAGQMPPESDAELIARLMRFYNADTVGQLVRMQDHHISKLQSKTLGGNLSRRSESAVNRLREG